MLNKLPIKSYYNVFYNFVMIIFAMRFYLVPHISVLNFIFVFYIFIQSSSSQENNCPLQVHVTVIV